MHGPELSGASRRVSSVVAPRVSERVVGGVLRSSCRGETQARSLNNTPYRRALSGEAAATADGERAPERAFGAGGSSDSSLPDGTDWAAPEVAPADGVLLSGQAVGPAVGDDPAVDLLEQREELVDFGGVFVGSRQRA
jgi:hypothetical protein